MGMTLTMKNSRQILFESTERHIMSPKITKKYHAKHSKVTPPFVSLRGNLKLASNKMPWFLMSFILLFCVTSCVEFES